jgi:hypothetical protein
LWLTRHGNLSSNLTAVASAIWPIFSTRRGFYGIGGATRFGPAVGRAGHQPGERGGLEPTAVDLGTARVKNHVGGPGKDHLSGGPARNTYNGGLGDDFGGVNRAICQTFA